MNPAQQPKAIQAPVPNTNPSFKKAQTIKLGMDLDADEWFDNQPPIQKEKEVDNNQLTGLRRGLTHVLKLEPHFIEALNNRPNSSKTQIIFPYDIKKRTYSRSEFSSSFCDYRISKLDIDKVFAELRNETKIL